MDLTHLKREKEEARLKMKRANKKRHLMQAILCKLNAEYTDAKTQFQRADRELAEHNKTVVPSLGEPKRKKKEKELNVDDLSMEQVAMLKARIEEMEEEANE